MVTVQGGTFPLYTDRWPTSVATFQIGKFEVTWRQWQVVRAWAVTNGYTDLADVGEGSDSEHPVRNVNWYDVMKWCNALSEMEGLMPVYKVDGLTYKVGQRNPLVTATANGYRLPTAAEWEYAARAVGSARQPFKYSGSNNLLLVGWFRTNSGGAVQNLNSGRGTWPVGAKLPNDLGIHDMSGNVWEWCQDFAGSGSAHTRGGSWYNTEFLCAVDSVNVGFANRRDNMQGFRLARNAP
jgi:sulfatase modifying factor 1